MCAGFGRGDDASWSIVSSLTTYAKRMRGHNPRPNPPLAPDLVINGDTDVSFSYIPTHIEYVLNELLKNAFRATCEHHHDKSHQDLPPVVVTIAKSPTAPVITIRVRDTGGGIPPQILPKATSYAFTTVNDGTSGSSGEDVADHRDDGPYAIVNAGGGVGLDDIGGLSSNSGHLAGLGFGLPLSKLHCEVGGRCCLSWSRRDAGQTQCIR